MRTTTTATIVLALVLFGAVVAQAGSAGTTPWTISSNPVWSPDGTSVAWGELDATGSRYRIETAATTAMSAPRTIYTAKAVDGDCCHSLTWTRSGRILFIANFTLLSVPVAGGTSTVLFHGSTPEYMLSPNQETVVVVDGCACGHATDKIAFVNVRGGAPRELPVARNVSDDPVTFSPDGTELVFSTATHDPITDGWSRARFMAVRVGGGTPVPLARSGIVGAQFLTGRMASATWSPDGNRIAAWLLTKSAARLITIDTHSGRTAVAAPAGTEAWAVSWSPDSSRLAYAATLRLGNDAQQALATVKPDGTGRKLFWNRASTLHYESESSGEPPAWSPDGSRLLFLARTGGESGPLEILTADAAGGGLTRLR